MLLQILCSPPGVGGLLLFFVGGLDRGEKPSGESGGRAVVIASPLSVVAEAGELRRFPTSLGSDTSSTSIIKSSRRGAAASCSALVLSAKNCHSLSEKLSNCTAGCRGPAPETCCR